MHTRSQMNNRIATVLSRPPLLDIDEVVFTKNAFAHALADRLTTPDQAYDAPSIGNDGA
jgi:hypothetical protein